MTIPKWWINFVDQRVSKLSSFAKTNVVLRSDLILLSKGYTNLVPHLG